jgi:hypothetical protein
MGMNMPMANNMMGMGGGMMGGMGAQMGGMMGGMGMLTAPHKNSTMTNVRRRWLPKPTRLQPTILQPAATTRRRRLG